MIYIIIKNDIISHRGEMMNYQGLSTSEVNEYIKKGYQNEFGNVKTKSVKSIILSNSITLFNILNVILGLGVFLVGSYKNLSFLIVIFLNTIISIVQEIQAKKMIDRLSFLARTKALVIRNGQKEKIDQEEIVLNDIIIYQNGDQIPVDSKILEGEIEVNESLITGEEDAIAKKKGDCLLSGSFITVGTCVCQVTHVGKENYISKISKGASKVKKVESEIQDSFNVILKWISFFIIPLGILLFIKQWYACDQILEEAIIKTTAALVGMIPEGLVLLTSTVMAVGVLRLAKYKVLVQEMYCIETLARIDTLCLDKTGTLTEGVMEVVDIIYIKSPAQSRQALNDIVYYSKDTNATMKALKQYFKNENDKPFFKETKNIPFSSRYKYSGSIFEQEGTYYLGALEFLKGVRKIDLSKYEEKYRTLVLSHNQEVCAIILLQDKIRKEARLTLEYFKKQGIDLKIISGDNPKTVAMIAKRCGLEDVRVIDMSEEVDITKVCLKGNVFGRVTPEQKKQLVQALKNQGHMVGMTGDGVNDVLALKEANLSIAMASGSEAARNISELVLLDSNFAALPEVLKEGRKSINNLQRSASLFLTKTLYSSLLAILFLIIPYPYPFMPVQLTLTSIFTIGIPSFILALEPNEERVKGKFLGNVILNSIPAALTIVANIILIIICTNIFNLSETIASTLCVMMIGGTGFLLIYRLCQPFNILRVTLLISLMTGFTLGVLGFKNFLSLATMNVKIVLLAGILFFLSMILFYRLTNVVNNYLRKRAMLCPK